MYFAHAAAKVLTDGPCIDDYGIGEAAEDISLSRDGLVLLLSAGFKLAVYTRASTDSAFAQAFNFTFGVVVNFAALSADGSAFVSGCDDGMCGYKLAASGSYQRMWSVASIGDFYFEYATLGTDSSGGLLAAAVMNNQDGTQWCSLPPQHNRKPLMSDSLPVTLPPPGLSALSMPAAAPGCGPTHRPSHPASSSMPLQ
jgi:hypothetical protein